MKNGEVVGFTLINECDVPIASLHRWIPSRAGYAAHCWRRSYRAGVTLLHRLILDAPDGSFVDHINGDRLDNRRGNLRLASRGQNIQNVVDPQGANPHRGVTFRKASQKWAAYIRANHRRVHLGLFDNLTDAIVARTEAERKYFGEFAPKRVDLCSA